jgi:hypothetical protein
VTLIVKVAQLVVLGSTMQQAQGCARIAPVDMSTTTPMKEQRAFNVRQAKKRLAQVAFLVGLMNTRGRKTKILARPVTMDFTPMGQLDNQAV